MGYNPGASGISGAPDVALNSVQNNNVLTYDTSVAKWKNAPTQGTADATPTNKGVIQLAGDLAGTAAAPSVPGLAAKANTSDVYTKTQVDNSLSSKADTTHTHTAANITDLTEATQDTVASTLVAGTNVSLNYDDTAGTLTVSAASGAGNTDLTSTYTSTTVTVESSTGTDATIAQVTTANAGVMSAGDKTKLDSIASGATANDTDANLKNRSNHTGTQPIASVTGLQTALDSKAPTSSLAPVATSGSYNDLTNKPTIPTVSDATISAKGIVQLAGDLAGTATAPTVPGLAGKEPSVTAGTTSQYYRGDKTWQTLDKTAVGLSNVDNTSDTNKPISTATQTALNTKAATSRQIIAGTGLTGGGDLTADRTLTVSYGTAAGTAAQGNDSRITGAEQAANKGVANGYASLNSSTLVPVAQLGSGTPSTATYLRGNGTWVNGPDLVLPFSVSGTLILLNNLQRLYVENSYTIASIRASVGVAPTGSSIIVDILKNGTSIFATTTANRPTIAASSFTALAGTPDTPTMVAGDYYTVSIVQIGSSNPGSDLTVSIRLRPS